MSGFDMVRFTRDSSFLVRINLRLTSTMKTIIATASNQVASVASLDNARLDSATGTMPTLHEVSRPEPEKPVKI